MPDSAAVSDSTPTRRDRQSWAAGDFSMVAATTTIVGELLCESVGLRSGDKVLDVATGSGNTALAAARRFCDVVGVDFVPALLERARERAAVERLAARFEEGEAESLPFAIGTFDVVLSTFGVMFASTAQRAAKELLRVCRAGGRIGLAHWTPDSFIGEVQRVSARYAPPSDATSPLLWGTEAWVRELLGDSVTSLVATRRTCMMRYKSVQHWMAFTRAYLGPVRQLLESLEPERQKQVAGEVGDVARRFNRSGDATMAVPADYLEIVATRR
jgi:ubiquinone/menaquinone biosynthesis C-methylase UbiE